MANREGAIKSVYVLVIDTLFHKVFLPKYFQSAVLHATHFWRVVNFCTSGISGLPGSLLGKKNQYYCN